MIQIEAVHTDIPQDLLREVNTFVQRLVRDYPDTNITVLVKSALPTLEQTPEPTPEPETMPDPVLVPAHSASSSRQQAAKKRPSKKRKIALTGNLRKSKM